ncbi:hypothetical protein ACRYCC_22180 [Actinomadura scrupuli]|uniref:hypothetical protein n=1 Tax=Actinomadura scrupuli TaxID=559629 RepID=UPI003D989558
MTSEPSVPNGTAGDFRPVNFTSSWREESLARICELRALIGSLRSRAGPDAEAGRLLADAETELAHAHQAARRRRIGGALTGAAVQRVHAHLDAAEILVLRAAPLDYVRGQTAALVVYVRRHLLPSDPRCQCAEQALEAEGIGPRAAGAAARGTAAPAGRLARATRRRGGSPTGARQLSPIDRERLVVAVQGAMAESRNEHMRVRSFRNLLLVFAGVLVALAIGVCVFGAAMPDKLPVCFQPVQVATAQARTWRIVCPTRESELPAQADVDTVVAATVDAWDIPLIEVLGLIAAAVATATALRKVRGTSTPYSLPAALALLKLPLGALTALLGLILMRGNFVPGLSALDSSAQILSWAVVLGYAQQAFTQVVDRKAQDLLEDVGGAEQREKPTAGSPPRP